MSSAAEPDHPRSPQQCSSPQYVVHDLNACHEQPLWLPSSAICCSLVVPFGVYMQPTFGRPAADDTDLALMMMMLRSVKLQLRRFQP